VARPIKANAPIVRPWNPPAKAMTPDLLVARRASLSAIPAASEPDAPSITRGSPGSIRERRSINSTLTGEAIDIACCPNASWPDAAATIAGWEWPKLRDPNPATMSRNRFPSGSSIIAPVARASTGGKSASPKVRHAGASEARMRRMISLDRGPGCGVVMCGASFSIFGFPIGKWLNKGGDRFGRYVTLVEKSVEESRPRISLVRDFLDQVAS
jgi:hypothetical protein